MKLWLSEYSADWPRMFKEEVENLKMIFGDLIIKYEHFGSTSVKGMKAKPVIDMICIVKNIEQVDLFNKQMDSLGYDVAGEWGIAGRRLFRKGGDNRTHHIHFYQFDHPEINRHLIFRDYLKAHPHEIIKYSRFKEELASHYTTTSEYSPAKKEFVREMEKKALKWFSEK
jgi:GrpB-like predicted nucleotidyltransferase (UPF0157 family)